MVGGAAVRKMHRAAHRKLWPLLGLLVGAGLVLALVLRPPPENAAPPESLPSHEGSFIVLEILR